MTPTKNQKRAEAGDIYISGYNRRNLILVVEVSDLARFGKVDQMAVIKRYTISRDLQSIKFQEDGKSWMGSAEIGKHIGKAKDLHQGLVYSDLVE